ncbi:Emp24/gp25L/p24 family protein, partial [Cooperia oncophora]
TIPVEYGGTRRDDSGHSEHPESCIRPYKPVTSAEYRGVDDVWSDHGFSKPPPSETFTMKSHQPVELVRECNRAGRLVWNFVITGDVEFEIVRREIGNDVKVWPKIVLTSLKLPEYGSIPTVPGKYVLRFDNPSTTLFSVKVKGAAEIKTSAE